MPTNSSMMALEALSIFPPSMQKDVMSDTEFQKNIGIGLHNVVSFAGLEVGFEQTGFFAVLESFSLSNLCIKL